MSVVGGFPGLANRNRRTVRQKPNPLDVCTIFSVYPRRINEKKHTIEPGVFVIPPGSPDKPSSLIVGPSSWWKDVGDDQPLLEIPNSSIQVAESVVKDYCNGIWACNMGDKMPGLFWLPGNVSVADLKKLHNDKLQSAITRQRNFFSNLVELADIGWARSNGNPLSISEDMRIAARELLLTNKDWMKNFSMLSQVRCKACGALKNPDFPVCRECKAIDDPEKAKALGLVFAQ